MVLPMELGRAEGLTAVAFDLAVAVLLKLASRGLAEGFPVELRSCRRDEGECSAEQGN